METSSPAPPIAVGGRSYSDRGGRWSYGRRLLATEGFWGTSERLATYPPMPWVRYGWGPLVTGLRSLTGTTKFVTPGGALRYAGPLGERTVELALAYRFVAARRDAGPVLEIGNVLDHYHPFPHVVVDRYEAGEEVVHQDVEEFVPDSRFPTIVSVSTLEHVGFDETPRRSERFVPTLRHLVDRCLAPGGRMLVTVPMGYNPAVDAAVFKATPELGRVDLYRHHGLRNLWSWVPTREWPTADRLPPYSFRRHRPEYVAIGEYPGP